jgi:hypothetical protein
MIKENTEPKDEQIIITPPMSTINHTIQQIPTTNNKPSIVTNKWKQVSLQGLDITPQETKLKISTPPQRVTFFSFNINKRIRISYILFKSIHQTAAVFHSNAIPSSLTTNDLTLSINLNEKPTYDNLANPIHCPLNKKFTQHFINNAYDNYPIISNPEQNSLGNSYF